LFEIIRKTMKFWVKVLHILCFLQFFYVFAEALSNVIPDKVVASDDVSVYVILVHIVLRDGLYKVTKLSRMFCYRSKMSQFGFA